MKIIKQTGNKHLNLYERELKNNRVYYLASRREKDQLACVTKDHSKCDAVMIITKHIEKDKFILLKQFRPSIDDYICEFPAGLVDKGEEDNLMLTAVRELHEETGFEIVEVEQMIKPCYSSVGMTDENVAIYFAKVKGEPNLNFKSENEDIEIVEVHKFEIEDFLRNNIVAMRTALTLRLMQHIRF